MRGRKNDPKNKNRRNTSCKYTAGFSQARPAPASAKPAPDPCKPQPSQSQPQPGQPQPDSQASPSRPSHKTNQKQIQNEAQNEIRNEAQNEAAKRSNIKPKIEGCIVPFPSFCGNLRGRKKFGFPTNLRGSKKVMLWMSWERGGGGERG